MMNADIDRVEIPSDRRELVRGLRRRYHNRYQLTLFSREAELLQALLILGSPGAPHGWYSETEALKAFRRAVPHLAPAEAMALIQAVRQINPANGVQVYEAYIDRGVEAVSDSVAVRVDEMMRELRAPDPWIRYDHADPFPSEFILMDRIHKLDGPKAVFVEDQLLRIVSQAPQIIGPSVRALLRSQLLNLMVHPTITAARVVLDELARQTSSHPLAEDVVRAILIRGLGGAPQQSPNVADAPVAPVEQPYVPPPAVAAPSRLTAVAAPEPLTSEQQQAKDTVDLVMRKQFGSLRGKAQNTARDKVTTFVSTLREGRYTKHEAQAAAQKIGIGHAAFTELLAQPGIVVKPETLDMAKPVELLDRVLAEDLQLPKVELKVDPSSPDVSMTRWEDSHRTIQGNPTRSVEWRVRRQDDSALARNQEVAAYSWNVTQRDDVREVVIIEAGAQASVQDLARALRGRVPVVSKAGEEAGPVVQRLLAAIPDLENHLNESTGVAISHATPLGGSSREIPMGRVTLVSHDLDPAARDRRLIEIGTQLVAREIPSAQATATTLSSVLFKPDILPAEQGGSWTDSGVRRGREALLKLHAQFFTEHLSEQTRRVLKAQKITTALGLMPLTFEETHQLLTRQLSDPQAVESALVEITLLRHTMLWGWEGSVGESTRVLFDRVIASAAEAKATFKGAEDADEGIAPIKGGSGDVQSFLYTVHAEQYPYGTTVGQVLFDHFPAALWTTREGSVIPAKGYRLLTKYGGRDIGRVWTDPTMHRDEGETDALFWRRTVEFSHSITGRRLSPGDVIIGTSTADWPVNTVPDTKLPASERELATLLSDAWRFDKTYTTLADAASAVVDRKEGIRPSHELLTQLERLVDQAFSHGLTIRTDYPTTKVRLHHLGLDRLPSMEGDQGAGADQNEAAPLLERPYLEQLQPLGLGHDPMARLGVLAPALATRGDQFSSAMAQQAVDLGTPMLDVIRSSELEGDPVAVVNYLQRSEKLRAVTGGGATSRVRVLLVEGASSVADAEGKAAQLFAKIPIASQGAFALTRNDVTLVVPATMDEDAIQGLLEVAVGVAAGEPRQPFVLPPKPSTIPDLLPVGPSRAIRDANDYIRRYWEMMSAA